MNKKTYIAYYTKGLQPPTKVLAYDVEDALKAAYAAYMYQIIPRYPRLSISDVVKSVRLSPDQTFNGPCLFPVASVDSDPQARDEREDQKKRAEAES